MTRHVFPLSPQTLVAAQGLTKRELFAAMVMQGLLSGGTFAGEGWEVTTKAAVMGAEALLAELEKLENDP